MEKPNNIKKTPFWRHWFVIEIYKFISILLSIVFIVSVLLRVITRHNKEIEVPDLVGISITEAEKIAERSSVRVDITDSAFIPGMKPGIILRQNPLSGEKVKRDRRIIVTINTLKAPQIAMPSLEGYSLRQAKAELSTRKLRIGKISYISDIATNNVLAQRYRGSNIPNGTLINIESEIDLVLGLSNSDERTSIPMVTGIPLESARDLIIENSLNVGSVKYDKSVKNLTDSLSSIVIKQNPPPSSVNSAELGTTVDLVLGTKTK